MAATKKKTHKNGQHPAQNEWRIENGWCTRALFYQNTKKCEYFRSILMKFGDFEHLHWYAFTRVQEHAFEWIDIGFVWVWPAIIHRFSLVICAFLFVIYSLKNSHWTKKERIVKSEQKICWKIEKYREVV